MARIGQFGRTALVIDMPGRPIYVAVGIAGLLASVEAWVWLSASRGLETPKQIRSSPIEAAPLCPWRQPEQDLHAFFPEGSRYETETRILSGLRTELAQRLGRVPTAGENALHLYRVTHESEPVGTVVVSRVKGEYGAIEMVLAINAKGEVCGLRFQRLREPEAIANVLERPEWLASFCGKTVQHLWRLGVDIPQVDAPVRPSAAAVVDGVRSLLVLLDVAGNPQALTLRRHH
jgi:hypothetical protein